MTGKVLVFSAFLMLMGALLIWINVIPMEGDLRTYVPLALAAAGVADLVIAVFFLKGNDDSGRI